MKIIRYIILLPVFILSLCPAAWSQKDTTRLKQEVEVTKAYQPTVSDAFKINDIPQIKDEKTEKPVFEYSIYSEPVFSTFSVKPVQAATMVGEPQPELGTGLLKLGIGNYLTPYGELFYNALPGKKSNFGMHFRHLSSHGKLKLMNDDKVKAPFSNNSVELFGKRFFGRSVLSVTGFFDRKGFQYYGYTGDRLTDAEKESIIPAWQDKQAFSKGGLDMNLKNNPGHGSGMNYDLGLRYHYFGAKTGQREHLGNLKVNLSKDFYSFKGVLNSGLTFYKADKITNRLVSTSDQRQQILLKVNPAVVFTAETAFLQIGANTYTMIDDDVSADFTITPNVKAEWSPVENILTLYAGADGYLDQNVYSKIAAENPFAAPNHDIRDAKYQYILSGGIKGKFSSRTNFQAGVSYSGIKNMHFYVATGENYSLETDRVLNNTFYVAYDNVKLLKFSGEIFHAASEYLSFYLKGNYYSYNMDEIDSPWYKPEFDVDMAVNYKAADDPLSLSFHAYVIGKRKALFVDELTAGDNGGFVKTIYSMDPVFDLNASAAYQYNDRLSFFLQLNNFAFQHYETWLGYANQGFNALAGVNFSF